MVPIVFLGSSGFPPGGRGNWTLIVCDYRLTGDSETIIHHSGVSHRIRPADLRKYLAMAVHQAARDGHAAIYVSGSASDGTVAVQFDRDRSRR